MESPAIHAVLQWQFNAYQLVNIASHSWPKISLLDSSKENDHTRLQWPEGLSEEGLLRWWISSNGGYIHPALHLTESPSCGGRGWVASGTIDYKTVCEEPVIVIPYGLGYFAKDAITELNTVLQRAGSKRTLEEMVPLSTLESGLPLAVALAYERKKGDQSEFWPHLRLLPTEPPSLWLKTTAEQSAIYDTLGWPSTRKKAVIKQLRAEKCKRENQLDTFLTKTKLHSLLGLTRDEVMWGLSTVHVREHSSGSKGNIKVGIDFLNHHHEAGIVLRLPPFGTDSDAAKTNEDPDVLQMIISSMAGKPAPLSEGDELFIIYPSEDIPGQKKETNIEEGIVQFGCVLEPRTITVNQKGSRCAGIDEIPFGALEKHYSLTVEEKGALNDKSYALYDTNPDHPYIINYFLPIKENYEKQEAEGLLSAEDIKQANPLMCVNPGCPRHPAYDRKQQFCTVCRAPYCSRNCQKAHWPEHKLRCKAAAARTEQVLKKLQAMAPAGPEGMAAAVELARKPMAGQHGNADAREEILEMLGMRGYAFGADK